MKIRIFFLLTFIYIANASAFYWDTLPKGIRTFEYRNITTDGIDREFDNQGRESNYSWKVDINSQVLEQIPGTEYFFEELKEKIPEAYDKLSIGEFTLDAKAEVNVQVFALAYGITDRLTVYAGVPYYKATVNMDYGQTKFNSYDEVASLISAHGDNDFLNSFENVISEQLPNITGENLQYLLTNYYGYSPAGTWYGEGYGDMELGAIYRLTDSQKYGAAMTLGLMVPTGVVDSSDTLQDIAFGDGQWDIWGEIGAGFIYKSWAFNTAFRYDHQLPTSRSLRVPIDDEFTLSENDKNFDVKLGDKIKYDLWTDYYYNDWLSFTGGYIFESRFATNVESGNQLADSILENNTEAYAHSARFAVTLDTVGLFKANKFVIPTMTELTVQSMLFGQNQPKVSRIQLKFRMFF